MYSWRNDRKAFQQRQFRYRLYEEDVLVSTVMLRTSKVKKEKIARVTASMFVKHNSCPHWVYFDAYGDSKKKGKTTAFSEMLLESGVLHEKEVISGLTFVEPKGRGIEARAKDTVRLMKEGVERIYHGVLLAGDMVGEPDLLERRDDKSSDIGPYHYVAVEIINAERISDAHKGQLSLYGELLLAVQGRRPAFGEVLNASGVRIAFELKEFKKDFEQALAEIREAVAGRCPPPHVSSGCKQSPWFGECKALAEQKDDVALLYNVKKKYILLLRATGVRTVHDAARVNPARLAEAEPRLPRELLERIVLQATALIEKEHYVRRPIVLPEAPFEIFFDIEGDPLRQVEYLFGFLVRQGAREKYVKMIAERPEHEERMWEEFLEWLESLPQEYVVYHYGDYERSRLAMLESAYRGSKALTRFVSRLVDLNTIVKDSIVFPLYFYGIKDIGGYIGYKRLGKIKGGGESVAFYEEWLTSGKRKKLDDIILYNEDDVIATRFLKDWLAGEKEVGSGE